MPNEYDPALDDGQQLVVYEGSEPEQQPQTESSISEEKYMSDLNTFVERASSMDEFYQFSRIFEVRVRNIPGSEKLRTMLDSFGREVSSMANDANTAAARYNSQNYTHRSGKNTSQVEQIREKFQPILQEIRQVVHNSWDVPGTQRAVQKTSEYLARYASGPINSRRHDGFTATPGANQEDRQNALTAVYTYLQAVKEQAQNKYVKAVSGAATEEEFFQRSYARMTKGITKKLDPELAGLFPAYDVSTFGPYGSEEGINKYCEALDSFFKTAIQNGKPNAVKDATAKMTAGVAVAQRANNLNSFMISLAETLQNPDYSQSAKRAAMSRLSQNLGRMGIDEPPLNGNVDIEKWLNDLGTAIGNSFGIRNANTKGMQVELSRFLEEAPERMALDTKVESLRGNYQELKNTQKRNFSSEFESMMEELGGVVDSNTAGLAVTSNRLDRVSKDVIDYCIRKVHQNKSSYDSMEASRLGNAIEILSKLDPERGKLMQDVFGMKVMGDGEKKTYSFRKIPESILRGPSHNATLTSLEEAMASNRERQTSGTEGPEIDRITTISSGLLKNVKNADPALMRSSQQYRNFRKAAQTLADEMAKVQKGGTLSPEKKQELLAMTKAVRDTSRAYQEYKKEGAITNNGMKRLAAAERSYREAEFMEDLLRAPDVRNAFRADPIKAIQDEMKYLIENRDASPANLAKLMFLKSTEKEISKGKDPKTFETVLTDPEKLNAQAREFEKSSSYEALIKNNPDIKMGKPMTGLNPDQVYTKMMMGMNAPQTTQTQPNVTKPQKVVENSTPLMKL